METLIQLHLIISGKVQEVFYRTSAKDKADEFELKGWVKNSDNGKVEILVQGDESKIKKFITWCKKGPKNADVMDVEIIEEQGFEDFRNFSILD